MFAKWNWRMNNVWKKITDTCTHLTESTTEVLIFKNLKSLKFYFFFICKYGHKKL